MDNTKKLKTITPKIPGTGNDRATDNWLPLFSITETAGGQWPCRACEAMLGIEKTTDSETTKQILLQDIKSIFEGLDKISSKELVEELVKVEDHPWSDWRRGKAITQNGLARLLKPFGIISKILRDGEDVFRGYEARQFTDVFARYLPPTPDQSVTTLQTTPVKGLLEIQSVTKSNNVTVEKRREATPVKRCNVVTVEKGVQEQGEKNMKKKPELPPLKYENFESAEKYSATREERKKAGDYVEF
jgi:hypothetical protein